MRPSLWICVVLLAANASTGSASRHGSTIGVHCCWECLKLVPIFLLTVSGLQFLFLPIFAIVVVQAMDVGTNSCESSRKMYSIFWILAIAFGSSIGAVLCILYRPCKYSRCWHKSCLFLSFASIGASLTDVLVGQIFFPNIEQPSGRFLPSSNDTDSKPTESRFTVCQFVFSVIAVFSSIQMLLVAAKLATLRHYTYTLTSDAGDPELSDEAVLNLAIAAAEDNVMTIAAGAQSSQQASSSSGGGDAIELLQLPCRVTIQQQPASVALLPLQEDEEGAAEEEGAAKEEGAAE